MLKVALRMRMESRPESAAVRRSLVIFKVWYCDAGGNQTGRAHTWGFELSESAVGSRQFLGLVTSY